MTREQALAHCHLRRKEDDLAIVFDVKKQAADGSESFVRLGGEKYADDFAKMDAVPVGVIAGWTSEG